MSKFLFDLNSSTPVRLQMYFSPQNVYTARLLFLVSGHLLILWI